MKTHYVTKAFRHFYDSNDIVTLYYKNGRYVCRCSDYYFTFIINRYKRFEELAERNGYVVWAERKEGSAHKI